MERKRLGDTATVTSRLLVERISPDLALLDLQTRVAGSQLAVDQLQSLVEQFEITKFGRHGPDPKKVAAYRKELGLLQRMGFCVRNAGQVLAEDVRVFLEVPKEDGLKVVDELPERPRGPMDFRLPGVRSFARAARTTDVKDLGASWEVVARFDKIQPTATAWSKPFWIGSETARDLPLLARVYGDNIPKAIEVPVHITIDLVEGYLELDKNDGEDDAEDEP